jgi:methanogen extracellular protein (TIGR04279 family)
MNAMGYNGTASGDLEANIAYNTSSIGPLYENEFPVYTNGIDNAAIASTLDASQDYANMDLQVGLINMSAANALGIPLPLSKQTLIDYGIFADEGTIHTNATGGATLPTLNDLSPGTYILVVYDNSLQLPSGIGLVASVPVIVTQSQQTIDVFNTNVMKNVINPGDTIGIDEELLNAPAKNYTYLAFAIPEEDYYGNISINAINNTENGISVSLNAFSINFSGNAFDLISEAKNNSTAGIQQLEKEWSSKDFYPAIDPSTTPGTGDTLQMELNSSAPTGQYVLITAVVDPDTLSLVSVNSTSFIVSSTYTYNLVSGWNLISVPLIAQNTSVTSFFPAIVLNNDVQAVWGWNDTAQSWMYYSPDPYYWFADNFQPINNIEPGMAYWVQMNNSASFNISGVIPSSAPESPVSMVSGWNFVGPTGLSQQTPLSIYPSAVAVWGWNDTAQNWMYNSTDPYYWFEDNFPAITSINPGAGYWVQI